MVKRLQQEEFIAELYKRNLPHKILTAAQYVDQFLAPEADIKQLMKQYRGVAKEIGRIVGTMEIFGPVTDKRTVRFLNRADDRLVKQSEGRFYNSEKEIVEGLGEFFAACIMARNELTLQQFIDTSVGTPYGQGFGRALATKRVADMKPLADHVIKLWPETP